MLMLSSESKKKGFVLDNTIINDCRLCNEVFNQLSKIGDIFINHNLVIFSLNYELKNMIIDKGVLRSNNTIEIDNNNNNIIIRKTNTFYNIYDEYNLLLSQEYEPIIMTTSIDVLLESKFKNMTAEIFKSKYCDNLGINTDGVDPKLNQFRYMNVIDDEKKSEVLERYYNDNWNVIDNIDIYGFTPLSNRQKCYVDLLNDDNINLVMCIGSAGSGKTFLACLLGLYKVLNVKKYNEIIISRSTIDIGNNSIGFLPGSKEDKMSHWVQPMKDNFDIILKKIKSDNFKSENIKQSDQSNEIDYDMYGSYGPIMNLSKKQKKKQKKLQLSQIKKNPNIDNANINYANDYDNIKNITTDSLINSEKIKIECLSFFRGRTFLNTFCIIDEAQNLTTHEIKTIITRVGTGSKLVMIGDIEQSDLKNKNADFLNATNKLSGNKSVGVIQLDKSVRSDIAKLAVEVL